MSDQMVPSYAVGSWVWCKAFNAIWWPGKVVDRSTVPGNIRDYMEKKSPIAIVLFQSQNSYEFVTNADKIFLYSCAQKLEFVKKGYSLHIKQTIGGSVVGNMSMKNFIEDVLSIEKEIGGDMHIFDQFRNQKRFTCHSVK